MTTDESKILIQRVNNNMQIAALINLVSGIITIPVSIFIPACKTLVIPAIVSICLGIYYEYRLKKLKIKAWEHIDTLIILAVINLFFGAFIPSILIALAIKNRHKANVVLDKSYIN